MPPMPRTITARRGIARGLRAMLSRYLAHLDAERPNPTALDALTDTVFLCRMEGYTDAFIRLTVNRALRVGEGG